MSSSTNNPKVQAMKAKLRRKLVRKQATGDQPLRTLDLETTQSVGECMIGRLKNDDGVLVLFNRACLSKTEIAAAQVAVGCNMSDRGSLEEAHQIAQTENIGLGAGKDQYTGNGLKLYKREVGAPLFKTDDARELFYQQYDLLENELRGVMQGVGDSKKSDSLALSCFSPYFPDTLQMSNRQPGVGSDLARWPEEVDDNGVTRRRLLSDRLWITTHEMPEALFDQRQTALALYERERKLVERHGVIRVHDRVICTDQITSLLLKHEAVKEVRFLQHVRKPWMPTSLVLVVERDRWAEFMADRKAVESRWMVWYLRSRCQYRVDLYSDGILVARYDQHTDLREDDEPNGVGSSSGQQQPVLQPLVRLNECSSVGCFLREDHIAEDAQRILRHALRD